MKELVNPTSHPNRSGKDLSHRKVFSAKAGELLPILCEEMVPNDYFEIDTASLIRTFPLRTAAFIRCRVHYDFFFVPKTSIWRNWDQFYYQRHDRQTSYQNGIAYEPNACLFHLNSNVNAASVGSLDSAAARAKLLQLLGYGTIGYYTGSDFSETGQFSSIRLKSLTVLPIMAYNRIYNMWYRNAWRDEPDADDAQTYSADSWLCTTFTNSLISSNLGNISQTPRARFLQMHYHPWFSDLFMGSLPNQQFGSVSSVDVSSSNLTVELASANSTGAIGNAQTPNGVKGLYLNGVLNASNLYGINGSGTFDVMQLRRALALQKWKEYNMRAGWKSRNQARAMFGVSTPEDRKHEIEFLKGYDFPVMIDEVVNQSDVNTGELAGKGIGVGNGEVLKFNSGERHGYLMCIAYILPEAEYDAVGIDKSLVRSEPFDHYVPAFENLGMEPIYKWELNFAGNSSVFNSVIGYAPRYHEYKTRVDKVYGEFMTNKSLSSWVSVRRDLQGIANSGSIPTEYFYVNPKVLDSVFLTMADGTQATDQFIVNCNFKIKAVRPMSDLGLPNL